METLRLRTWGAILLTVLAAMFVAPNMIDTSKLPWWPAKKLNYGLDIQGGVHLVMGADIATVVQTTVVRQTKSLEAEFLKENISTKGFVTDKASDGVFSVLVGSFEEAKKVEAAERRVLEKLAWQAYRATHIVHLGSGVHWSDKLEADRFDVERREDRLKANDLPDWKSPEDLAQARRSGRFGR